jgi:hypothetical protein
LNGGQYGDSDETSRDGRSDSGCTGAGDWRTTGVAAALRTIQMFDQCDPDTFNAMFGDGTA